MTTEQAIMSAVVRTDMFLANACKYGLAAVAVVMLTVIAMIRRKR